MASVATRAHDLTRLQMTVHATSILGARGHGISGFVTSNGMAKKMAASHSETVMTSSNSVFGGDL
jgi:hypothetical protein